jgi:hypothetical protein
MALIWGDTAQTKANLPVTDYVRTRKTNKETNKEKQDRA